MVAADQCPPEFLAIMAPPQSTPPSRSVLALDVGDVRIGVALSESGIIASPQEAIARKRLGRKGTLDAVQELVTRHRVGTILLGLPLLEGGAEGEQAEKTRAFGRSLARRIPEVEIVYRDERYTTAEARDMLGPGPHAPGRVDSIAAALLLKEYLDQPRPGNPDSG
jgi:putative Holliday junction resolvase